MERHFQPLMFCVSFSPVLTCSCGFFPSVRYLAPEHQTVDSTNWWLCLKIEICYISDILMAFVDVMLVVICSPLIK